MVLREESSRDGYTHLSHNHLHSFSHDRLDDLGSEGFVPFGLKGLSKEHLYFSPSILVFMALSLTVTWSLCVPSGVWALVGLHLGIGVGKR